MKMFKYPLAGDAPAPGDSFTMTLPRGAVVRAVRRQRSAFGDGVMVWAEVDPDAEPTEAEFTAPAPRRAEEWEFGEYVMVPTGADVPPGEYLATVFDQLGLVWHAYSTASPEDAEAAARV
jgi:cell wall-associated NlpC family hydrolase